MCDYSLEGFPSRKAQVGDRLTISRYAHGFMEESAARKVNDAALRGERCSDVLCLTCLKPGTKLDVTINGQLFSDVEFRQFDTGAYRDHLMLPVYPPVAVASLPRGTTATVLSIPGKQTLDQKLGLDQLRAEVPRDPAPEPVAQMQQAQQAQLQQAYQSALGPDVVWYAPSRSLF